MELATTTVKLSNLINKYDVSSIDEDYVENLEKAIQEANNRYQRSLVEDGEPTVSDDLEVADALYDRVIEILKELAPDSPLAKEIWESYTEDSEEMPLEYRELRDEFPMKSIAKVKSLNSTEYRTFKDKAPSMMTFLVSLKLNGWGIEIYYKHGQFDKAFTRGRSSVVDITSSVYHVISRYGLLEIESIRNVDLACIRGELILRNDRLAKAREYKQDLVSPLSAVQSLLGSKTPAEYKELLSFRGYRYIEHGLEFSTRSEEFKFIKSLGFKVPTNFIVDEVSIDELDEVVDLTLEEMSSQCKDDLYFADGVVMQLNNYKVYNDMGTYSYADYGGLALKMGDWSQNHYTGFVQFVSWTGGKGKFTPRVVLGIKPDLVEFEIGGVIYEGFYDFKENCPNYEHYMLDLTKYVKNYDDLGVPTSGGQRVKHVPVYNVNGLISLGVRVNGILGFKYGEETGVIPCDSFGNPYLDLKEDFSFDNGGVS